MTRIVGLLLALVVAITSQQLALARGQASVAGSMTLCSGGGFITVAVDARGEPVGPVHICPDGIAAFIAATGDAPDLADRDVAIRAVDPILFAALDLPQSDLRLAQARAPPSRA